EPGGEMAQTALSAAAAGGGKEGGRNDGIWEPVSGECAHPLKGKFMALEMKNECEKCDRPLPVQEIAMICYYECTFGQEGCAGMNNICPNCGGELVRRPRRK